MAFLTSLAQSTPSGTLMVFTVISLQPQQRNSGDPRYSHRVGMYRHCCLDSRAVCVILK
jgi:hypothetical protein